MQYSAPKFLLCTRSRRITLVYVVYKIIKFIFLNYPSRYVLSCMCYPLTLRIEHTHTKLLKSPLWKEIKQSLEGKETTFLVLK